MIYLIRKALFHLGSDLMAGTGFADIIWPLAYPPELSWFSQEEYISLLFLP